MSLDGGDSTVPLQSQSRKKLQEQLRLQQMDWDDARQEIMRLQQDKLTWPVSQSVVKEDNHISVEKKNAELLEKNRVLNEQLRWSEDRVEELEAELQIEKEQTKTLKENLEQSFQRRLSQQSTRHASEIERLKARAVNLEEEVTAAREIYSAHLESSNDDIIKGLNVELQRLQNRLNEQEAWHSTLFQEMRVQSEIEMAELYQSHEREKAKLEGEVSLVKETRRIEMEEVQRLAEVLRGSVKPKVNLGSQSNEQYKDEIDDEEIRNKEDKYVSKSECQRPSSDSEAPSATKKHKHNRSMSESSLSIVKCIEELKNKEPNAMTPTSYDDSMIPQRKLVEKKAAANSRSLTIGGGFVSNFAHDNTSMLGRNTPILSRAGSKNAQTEEYKKQIKNLLMRIKQVQIERDAERLDLNERIEMLSRICEDHERTIDQFTKSMSEGYSARGGVTGQELKEPFAHEEQFSQEEWQQEAYGSRLDIAFRAEQDAIAHKGHAVVLKDPDNYNEAWIDSPEEGGGMVKKIQAELNSAKSVVEHLSLKLTHHRKESHMLYMQIQAAEEDRVHVEQQETMESIIANLQSENQDLKNQNVDLDDKIQGEAMLITVIEDLRKLLSDSKRENEELQRQLQAQADVHQSAIEKMKEKMKTREDAENRMLEIEEFLLEYNKGDPSVSISSGVQKDHETSPKSDTEELISLQDKVNEGLRNTIKILEDKVEEQTRVIQELRSSTNNPFHTEDDKLQFMSEHRNLQRQGEQHENRIKRLKAKLLNGKRIIIRDYLKTSARRRRTRKRTMSKTRELDIAQPETRTSDSATLARIESLMTVEVKRMREEVKAKTEKLEKKEQEVKELHTKLEFMKGDQSQKQEFLKHLINEREMGLSQLREKTDLQIKNLQEELVMKNDISRIERERLEGDVEKFRSKAEDFERNLNQYIDADRQTEILKKEIARLTAELATSREETQTACSSKVRTVRFLAEEMERLRYRQNDSNIISIKKNIFLYGKARLT